MQNNFIPQKGINPAMMMQQFNQFKRDYYAQNGTNANPKQAVMETLAQNGMNSQDFIQQGSNLYTSMFGSK